MKTKITAYILVDGRTGRLIKLYGPDKRRVASRRADRLDLQYGSYRYQVRPVFHGLDFITG